MDRKKYNNSNAGMTLLEVIVAVSIFSITAIVLLQSFVTSNRINKKSNTYMEATTVAQNIMEEIKAKKFEEVSLAFNYPVDSAGYTRLNFLNTQIDKVLNGTLGIKEVLQSKDESKNAVYKDVSKYREGVDEKNITASVISKDNGKTYEFNARKSGENASKYFFELTNVTNNHESFDALVEFDGSSDSGYKKKTVTNNEQGKNDYLSPNISNLDTKSNILFIVPKEKYLNEFKKDNGLLDRQYRVAHTKWENDRDNYCGSAGPADSVEYQKLLSDFTSKYPEPEPLSAEKVFSSAKKTLVVTLDYEEEIGEVKVKFKYKIDAHDYVSEDDPVYGRMDLCKCGGDTDNEGDSDEYFCTINTEKDYTQDPENGLKNIYIFYYPNYNSTNATKALDTITFENLNNYPVNLYVSKQQDEESKKDNSLARKENMYRMSLTIKENPYINEKKDTNWNTNSSLFRSQTKLRTNLDYNISYEVLDRPKISQMKLTYQGVDAGSGREKNVSGTGAKNILNFNGLDDKEEADRIYTAKVSVYKAGAAEKNFPKEDLIVSLDGAKED